MLDASTSPSFDQSYTIERLKRQARNMRLEAARAAALLATQLTDLAVSIEAEVTGLERAALARRTH